VLALLLARSMAFAFARHRFFGRELVNSRVTLPIHPARGHHRRRTGLVFFRVHGTALSAQTVIIGHTTFWHRAGVQQRARAVRRLVPSMEEASRDLGASGWQTFLACDLPSIRTALIAGALLAFALSFDEIAVTFFLAGSARPRCRWWILGAFRNAQALPEVNAVATVILLISLPMIGDRGVFDARRGCGVPGRAG